MLSSMPRKEKLKLRRSLNALKYYKMREPEMMNMRSALFVELNDLFCEEVIFWLQLSNAKRLLKGDRNTAFHHRVVNRRKRKNTIVSLSDGENIIEGAEICWLTQQIFTVAYLGLCLDRRYGCLLIPGLRMISLMLKIIVS